SIPPPGSGTPTVAELAASLAAAEETLADLHSQMLASSELIKALADQNAQLIKHIELHRKRIVALAAAVVLSLALGATAVGLLY
ncbi:MAG: hypothetical protein JWQ72_3156, partial [Polaromonas sp.]|nr:hypothetical protein [Polaromonas sp.]